MASTQPHNAQADPRFIARDLPLCRPAHATRKEMSRAVGRPLAMAPCDEQTSPFAPAPKKAAATVRHACSLSNVEMTYLFSYPGITESNGLPRKERKHAEAISCP